MKTTERLQRITSKGQITLPVAWRKRFETDTIMVQIKDNELRITPFITEDDRDEEWVSIFDAVRDNNGKGMPAEDFIKLLERIK